MDHSSPGSFVHGILQARILKWAAISFSRGSSQPRDWTCISCTAGRFFTIWATREALECWTRGGYSALQFSSVQSLSRVWLFRPHGLQHARLPCPSPTPGACSNSCPSCRWCHPTTSSSVVPFFYCLQSFPASGSLTMSQFFASGGQSIGVSASALVLPMNVQDWFPLELTGWISLQSKGLSRVLSNTTVQKH